MCKMAFEVDPWQLKDVPDHFKTQKICDKAARDQLFSLQHAPDWFVTQEQIGLWHDDKYVYNDNRMIEWYDGYKKRKAQKAKIKEELIRFACHPSRWWNWCVPEGEKKETEKLWK